MVNQIRSVTCRPGASLGTLTGGTSTLSVLCITVPRSVKEMLASAALAEPGRGQGPFAVEKQSGFLCPVVMLSRSSGIWHTHGDSLLLLSTLGFRSA